MKVIAPRVPTPGPPATGRSTTGLPDALLAEQTSRVRLLSGVSLGMWTFGLLMNALVFPRTIGVVFPQAVINIEIGACIAALVVFLYLRYSPCPPSRKGNIGLGLMVLNAAAVTWVDMATGIPLELRSGLPSWV